MARIEIVPFERAGVLHVFIERKYYRDGTNGILYVNGTRFCNAIELPWKNNMPRKSCIPEGVYKLQGRTSEHFGKHLQVMNVPGREGILVHPANNALTELKGCIAPVTTLTGEGCGSESRKAFEPLVERVYDAISKGDEVRLTISRTAY